MEICVESFDGEKYTVEVGVDDTTADIRRKVASAAELCEDGFDISFGGKVMAEGDDTMQLSAGDTIVLTKTLSQKDDAIAALRDVGETNLTTERFKGLKDPKLIHLFLRAEVVTEIPNTFLQGSTFEELDLSGVSGVTAIGANFLCECRSLHTADLSGWSNVTHIDSSFLEACSTLKALHLTGWSNVTQVGSSFLGCCSTLTTVDLSRWSNVTHIDRYFLEGCSALTTLDLSGWRNVTHIEYGFLSDCTALTTVDLSGWDRLKRIKHGFLSGCIALRRLDLSGWRSVTEIGTGFLEGCSIHPRSINITGSSCVVSDCVHGRNIMDNTKCHCVCT